MPASVTKATGFISVTAHIGDAKTLLAFDLKSKASAKDLSGFSIAVAPHGPGQLPYYIDNTLVFEVPTDHARVPGESDNSSANAPFHKFRWLHVPGSVHQGLKPFFGPYTYTVTAATSRTASYCRSTRVWACPSTSMSAPSRRSNCRSGSRAATRSRRRS